MKKANFGSLFYFVQYLYAYYDAHACKAICFVDWIDEDVDFLCSVIDVECIFCFFPVNARMNKNADPLFFPLGLPRT